MSSRRTCPAPPGPLPLFTVDLVHGDLIALAAHMQHCAASRGPMFGAPVGHLQAGASVAAGRIVTVACVGRRCSCIAVLAVA